MSVAGSWKTSEEDTDSSFDRDEDLINIRCETPQATDDKKEPDFNLLAQKIPQGQNVKKPETDEEGSYSSFVTIQIREDSPARVPHKATNLPAAPKEILAFHPSADGRQNEEDLFDLELNDEPKIPRVNNLTTPSLKKSPERDRRQSRADEEENNRPSRSISRGDGHRMERSEIQLMKLSLLDTNLAEQVMKDRQQLSKILNECTCYGVIPESSKMVVLDMQLPVTSALRALEENNMRSAPLWDETKMEIVGIITVTDFIEILLHFHKQPQLNIFEELQKHKIETWKEIIWGEGGSPALVSAHPNETLYQASQTLLTHRIHRLPIIDRAESNTILHIITHFRLLAYIAEKMDPKLSIFSYSVEALGIGTYKNVVTVLKDTPLHVVLTLLSEGRISAVPIIDENGEILDVYSKSDVIVLVKQVSENFLHESVGTVLEYKQKEPFYTCSKKDTLGPILSQLVRTRVHRLVCVDNTNRVEGVISLSDILNYFTVNI
ncbi:CBS domain-containing protein [Planoprotostelium fungivorum]|uniref:CBS domain-containing protein n=1 Tax=Planoprotostelium fungivorum TaxID=1890364 RepID=A0A2P6NY50_9EUKA|nr:CBS domain-containing protein [Planoprotostelium fungivorum]